MQKDVSTGLIRIVKVPAGEAPLKVRQAWVGLVLPCDPYLGCPDEGMDKGVLSGKKATRNRNGFSVPQDSAIAILAKRNPEAAVWWKEFGFPQANGRFSFAEDEAEIISGVTHKRVFLVTEEMYGDPNR